MFLLLLTPLNIRRYNMGRENLIEKYTQYGEADVHIPGTEYVICSQSYMRAKRFGLPVVGIEVRSIDDWRLMGYIYDNDPYYITLF